MSRAGHNSKPGGPIDADKLIAFAERFREIRATFKEDAATLIEDAGKADIEAAALRRLVSWQSQDHVKRAEREAIDDQYRFLAGERATPATLPAGCMLALAVDLYRNDATVRTVAETLDVSVGKAYQLKTQAAAFLVHVHVNVNAEVREMLASDLGEYHPAGQREEIIAKATPGGIHPRPAVWAEITFAREAHHARVEAEKQATRERRRREREKLIAYNKAVDEDPLTFPPHLDARSRTQGQGERR